MTTTEQILAAALGLPAEERVRLVDALVQSLDDDHRDPAAGSPWLEVKARLVARQAKLPPPLSGC